MPPHDAFHLGFAVFQREIAVPGRMLLEIGDLPLNLHIPKRILDTFTGNSSKTAN